MSSSNVDDFVNFLRLNVGKIYEILNSEKRTNWKGEECADISTSIDVKCPISHLCLPLPAIRSSISSAVNLQRVLPARYASKNIKM